MMNKLLLTAVACALVTSCSSTYMADVAPETRNCEIGGVEIGGFNASSVVSYCRNPCTGYIETAGIQVHRDSGINNTAKLAASAGAIAGGTGQVLGGVGALKYGQAWRDIARNGLTQRFEGMSDTNIHVEGSSAHSGDSTSAAASLAGAKASASARQKTNVHNVNNNVNVNKNTNYLKNEGGKPKGGHGKPKHNW